MNRPVGDPRLRKVGGHIEIQAPSARLRVPAPGAGELKVRELEGGGHVTFGDDFAVGRDGHIQPLTETPVTLVDRKHARNLGDALTQAVYAQRLVLASQNPAKTEVYGQMLGEEARLTPARDFAYEVIEDNEAHPYEGVRALEQNAAKKALAVFDTLGGRSPVLADDSGFYGVGIGNYPGSDAHPEGVRLESAHFERTGQHISRDTALRAELRRRFDAAGVDPVFEVRTCLALKRPDRDLQYFHSTQQVRLLPESQARGTSGYENDRFSLILNGTYRGENGAERRLEYDGRKTLAEYKDEGAVWASPNYLSVQAMRAQYPDLAQLFERG